MLSASHGDRAGGPETKLPASEPDSIFTFTGGPTHTRGTHVHSGGVNKG